MAEDNGGMRPVGGLTRNLFGEEVWILKAMGAVTQRDLRRTVARHLQFNAKSIHTSGSPTSTSFSIISDPSELSQDYSGHGPIMYLRESRD